MLTQIYHPNISGNGKICLELLSDKTKWNPQYGISKIVLAILSLLLDPNPKDPYCPDIAGQYLKDIKKFNDVARQWTSRYA
jgi:ubiquitin-conjugating enzyme E2 D/E